MAVKYKVGRCAVCRLPIEISRTTVCFEPGQGVKLAVICPLCQTKPGWEFIRAKQRRAYEDALATVEALAPLFQDEDGDEHDE